VTGRLFFGSFLCAVQRNEHKLFLIYSGIQHESIRRGVLEEQKGKNKNHIATKICMNDQGRNPSINP